MENILSKALLENNSANFFNLGWGKFTESNYCCFQKLYDNLLRKFEEIKMIFTVVIPSVSPKIEEIVNEE